MPRVDVKRLSHAAIKVRDLAAQEAFYTEMVGLGKTAQDAAGRSYLRCNAAHHALVLVPDAERGLDHLALDVGTPAALRDAAAALTQADVPFEPGPAGEPGHGESLRLRDPDGFVVELVAGLADAAPSYGVRCVQPRKIGHVTLLVQDAKRTAAFYRDVLGFRESNWVAGSFVWMRCNPDHHGLAFAEAGGRIGLHHVAFEVLNFGELAQQADHLMRHGYRILYGPGRHGPGNNQFEYFRDREGNIIEFMCDIEQIWDDSAFVPRVWDPNGLWVNMWGPEPPSDFL
jgi:catechol-2,3-dioxygenase